MLYSSANGLAFEHLVLGFLSAALAWLCGHAGNTVLNWVLNLRSADVLSRVKREKLLRMPSGAPPSLKPQSSRERQMSRAGSAAAFRRIGSAASCCGQSCNVIFRPIMVRCPRSSRPPRRPVKRNHARSQRIHCRLSICLQARARCGAHSTIRHDVFRSDNETSPTAATWGRRLVDLARSRVTSLAMIIAGSSNAIPSV